MMNRTPIDLSAVRTAEVAATPPMITVEPTQIPVCTGPEAGGPENNPARNSDPTRASTHHQLPKKELWSPLPPSHNPRATLPATSAPIARRATSFGSTAIVGPRTP